MKKTSATLATAASLIGAFGLVSCAQEPPVYIESPEVHNVTVVEKPVYKPKPKPKPKPTPVRVRTDSSAEGFRAVY